MRKKLNYIFIIVFLLIIILPFIGVFFKIDKKVDENRNLTKIKDVTGITSLQNFINDNYGFRNLLSKAGLAFQMKILKDNPIPTQAQFGKDGFLFLGNMYNRTHDSSLGILDIKDLEVKETYNNILKIKQFCDSLKTDFYLVIAPNKETIYPEYLEIKPNKLPRFRELIVNKLLNTNINIIDLTPFLIKEKQNNILYYRYDSHWNNYGGFLGTKEIIEKISKRHKVKKIKEEDYFIKKEIRRNGHYDISNMLNMDIPDHEYFVVEPREKQDLKVDILKKHPEILYIKNLSNNNGIKAIIIRDSFFEAMKIPFISSIQEALVSRSFDKKEVLKEIKIKGKPDFIVYEIVERDINRVSMK